MSNVSRRRDLTAIQILITQAEHVLTTANPKGGETTRAQELLVTARKLIEGLISHAAAVEKQEQARGQHWRNRHWDRHS